VSSVLWWEAADAQPWPSRPITLVAAFTPGSASDYAARAIAQDLSKTLGQTVIVENRAGGGGAIASVTVAKAPPDGYTLLITAIGPAVLRPLIEGNLPYDPVADFSPIILVGDSPNVLAVGPQSTFGSLQDVASHAKRNQGKLTIGHPGAGTMGHLTALVFAAEAGFEANFIAYQGTPPILSDLLGGHIDVGSFAYGGGGTGAVKILAVTTDERLSFLPDVPTTRESNFPNVVGSTWHGIFAPAGTAPDVISRLNTAINDILSRDETRKGFETVGYRALGGPPDRLRNRMAEDHAKWSKVVAAAKIGGAR
jgi:tripartite-type tricarboxylate transporter receptor subunit TctC